MTFTLYFLIGIIFVFAMEHFHADEKRPDITMFLVLIFLALIWPVTLACLLCMNFIDLIRDMKHGK